MAKKSRARASAKSKAIADILADIELIEEALLEAEEHAEQGGGYAAGGGVHGSSGAGHGKASASSAMERMAQQSGAHATSKNGGSVQQIANLLNTHNPHSWIRNAMNGNISGGTLQRVGELASGAGISGGASLMEFGARFAPHIYVAHRALSFAVNTAMKLEERRATVLGNLRQMSEVEFEYTRRNALAMTTEQLTNTRRLGASLENYVTQRTHMDSVLGGLWSMMTDPSGHSRTTTEARDYQDTVRFLREHPHISKERRDQLSLTSQKKNDQVLKSFEIRGADVAGLGVAAVLTAGVGIPVWMYYNQEATANMWYRLFNFIGDPGKVYDSELTRRAEQRNNTDKKEIAERQKQAMESFWNDATVGPIRREQELERTRWQDAVHEDYIIRFLQWNTA